MALISREDTWREFISKIEDIADLEDIDKILSSMPTIEERKEGRWIFDEKGYFFCSECKRNPNSQYAVTDYCPNCGAKMEESE